MTKRPEIDALIAQMTIEEKVGQLNLAPNEDGVDPNLIRSGKLGAVICASSAYAGNDRQARVRVERINELQRLAKEESRLGIPLLVGRDVIHGHRTVAPIPLGQACSWSPEDIEACAKVACHEAVADGIRWIYTPMLDIARDPRWGRVAEGYGEDPYLTSVLATAAVKGLQQREGTKLLAAACAKHFAGYGSVEGGRDYNTGEIGPFTMRNIYMPSFKAAVDAGVASVMTCFNDISGVPVTADAHLVRQVLKTEWGFEGPTVSDWGAVAELVCHGIAGNASEAAKLAILAGIDIDMASDAYLHELAHLVKCNDVPLAVLNESVARVLALKFDLGLFDNPYTDEGLAQKSHLSQASKKTTLELTLKSVVMLKNSGVLPLAKISKVGLFGPFVDERAALLGTWCLDGEAGNVVSVRQAFEEELGEENLLVSTLADESMNLSRYCDVAFVCVGESPSRTGEANSTTTIDLPPGQLEFIKGVKRMGVPVVAVVFAGRPVNLSWLDENADAILYALHPGLFGAVAIARIAVGKAHPSGRLPITFPRSTGQIPIYYNHRPTGRPLDPYGRGVSRYVDEKDSPLYPFGHGLTYGKVQYENLEVKREGEGFTVACSVSNIGDFDCEEVVQLYVADLVAQAARPVRELKGFKRIAIPAGGSVRAEFALGEEHLGYFGPDEKWKFEAGEFHIWVGPDSATGLRTTVEV